MSAETIKLSISSNFIEKTNTADGNEAFVAFSPVAWSPKNIARHLLSGGAVSVANLKKPYRDESNFESSQLIGVDFDLGPSVAELMANPFVNKYAFLVMATASSTPDKPRTRAYFLLDRPVTNAVEYRQLVSGVMGVFKQYDVKPDPQCKDATRIFYGAINRENVHRPELELPAAIVQALLEKAKQDEPSPRPRLMDRRISDILLEGSLPGSRNAEALRMVGHFCNLIPPSQVEAIMRIWYERLPDTSSFSWDEVRGMVKRMGAKSAGNLKAVQEALKATAAPTVVSGKPVVTSFADFIAGSDEDMRWTIEGWLPEATTALMVAAPSSFKTWLGLAMCLSVATGTPFLGQFKVERPQPVLVIQQEDAKDILRQRMRTIYAQMLKDGLGGKSLVQDDVIEMPIAMPMLDVLTAEETFRFDNSESLQTLRREIEAHRYKLVMIDPLYSATNSEDYMAKDAQRMVELKRIRDKYGCSFLVLHHTRKSSNGKDDKAHDPTQPPKINREDAWGSQFLNAWLETGFQIRVQDAETKTIVLQRHFKSSGDVSKHVISFGISTKEDDRRFEVKLREPDAVDKRTDIVGLIKAKGGRVKHSDVAKELGLSGSSLTRYLKELVSAGELVKHSDGTYSGVTPVPIT